MNAPWTPARAALVGLSAASALALLYVGLFQIRWIWRLACPGFGTRCESVALSRFAWPFGLADGLLGAALLGLICALAQLARRAAARAVVALAGLNLVLQLVGIADMQHLGAYCLWCTLTAVTAAPILLLSLICARG